MYSLYILNTKVVNINIYEDNPYTIRIYENNCPHFTSIEKNYEQIIIQQRLTTKFLGFKPNYRHYSIQSLQSLQLEHQAIIFNIVITIFNLLELFVCILLDYMLYYSYGNNVNFGDVKWENQDISVGNKDGRNVLFVADESI